MKEKAIFITGGNTGIGLAVAEKFAKHKVNIAFLSRRPAENKKAKDFLEEAYGIKCLSITGSVTNEEDVEKALTITYSEFGQLNFAFNNAGLEQPAMPLTQQTVTDFDNIMNTNVKGVWLAMKHQIPFLQKSGGGAIVNTASVLGLVAAATVPLYVAAKHAVVGLSKSIALEYAKENIRVNALCPGGVETEMLHRYINGEEEKKSWMMSMHPAGRLAQPSEMAEGVFWLCSDGASFMTGQTLVMDGGWTAL